MDPNQKQAGKKTPAQPFSQAAWAEIPADVLGSYTGVPGDGEQPVQDADDL